MKIGHVDAILGSMYPTVSIGIRGRNDKEMVLDAVLDTGFTGTVSIPDQIIRETNLAFSRREMFVLADGTRRVVDVYDGSVLFAGVWYETDVFSTHHVAIVGMRLMYGANISLDAVPNGEISYTSLDLPRPRWPLSRR